MNKTPEQLMLDYVYEMAKIGADKHSFEEQIRERSLKAYNLKVKAQELCQHEETISAYEYDFHNSVGWDIVKCKLCEKRLGKY